MESQPMNAKVGQFQLVLSKKHPNRCKKCGTSANWPIVVKIKVNAIGNIHFCTECGTFDVQTPEFVWLSPNFMVLCENVEKLALST